MNNNRIQIVRGNLEKLLASTEDVVYGQPIFINDDDKRYLVVGKKSGSTTSFKLKNIKPITVREVIGYFDDNSELKTTKDYLYKVSPTNDALEIYSSKNIKVKVSDDVYALFNTTQNVITGDTRIDNFRTTNINSTNDIAVNAYSSKVFNIYRVTNFKNNVKFDDGKTVRSKFVVNGADSASNSITIVEAENTPFLTNTSTSQFNKKVTVGTSDSSTNELLLIKGLARATSAFQSPTIKTAASSTRVEMAQNSGSPFLKMFSGNNSVFALTTSALSTTLTTTFSGDVTVASNFNLTAANKKATIREAEIDTLTVKTLVIN